MRKYNFSGKNSAQSSAVAPLYITKQQKEQNVGGFLGGIGYLGEKLATGFFQSIEGISDYTLGGFAKLFGADDWAEEQFENDWFGDWYTHPDEWYNPSEGWKVAGDVAGGIGTSLPSLAAGATAAGMTILSGGTAAPLAAGLASAATAGLGAAGTGTKEAYKKTGQLGGKEFGYGALSGLVEGTTEGVTNALTLGTGAVLKNITKSFGKEITQTVAKQSAVKGLLGGFLGEAFEEGLSEWVNPHIARITYDADAENATAQEIFYSALIGGLSGMVMEGVNIAADTGNSFAKGAKIANSGREGEVLGLSRNLAAFQNENATENEAFRAVADTYKTLSESLALTGGKITTAAQKKQLGDLSRANVSAVFSPMITRSAANIYANAEAIADALGTYGYKDADGKPMNFTAEQIREGIDPANKKSLARALKTNTVLRTLAVADVTGQMMMDTQKFRDATLAGKNLARRADLWRFAEEGTPDEIRSVSEALGIDNWETLTEDEFAEKITTFLRDGGAKRYADLRAESERIFADESEAAALPTLIALEDGQTRKYKTGEDTVAIARKGEGYRIFDYGTRQTSREMSRAEVNKALADNNLRGQAISARMQEYAAKTAEIKRKTQETDTWARENTKGYAELSAPNKTMIRKVIRSAKENGIADEDIKTYSSISAHSGVDIVFSKRLTKVDGGYADAFYDPKKNRIVVNPEATRSAEKILLHELDHAIRTGIRKDGGTKLFADALFGISDEAMEKITARYKDMESDVSTDELIADEANAYFAETVFADKKVLEQLTKKVPTLKERIISFLEGAVTSYAGEPKLEGAAKRYLKQYKKMFAEFAERNAGTNAEEGAAGAARYALPEDVEAALFDDEFYEQFAGESKEKITETPAELENIINSDAFKDMDYDTQFDTRAKLKAVNAGYDTLYDYYVGRRKASIAEDYERYIKTGRDNAVSRKLKEKQAAKVKQEKISVEKSDATPHKNAQFDIIQQTNPMYDEFHTGIRSPKDIKTFAEVVDDAESFNWGDFTREDAKAALEAGKIRIYSSYAIKNGVFVSTSYKQALDYAAGNAKSVHSRTVALDSVAWINGDEGQYARVTQKKNDGRRYALPEDYTPTKADKEYIAALERGDMETAQKMVDEVAKAAGYVPVSRYHQTGAKFNEFMNDHPDAGLNDSDTPNGFFFKENDHDIGVGADFVKTGHGGIIQMRVYLKHNNMLYFKDRDEARVWYSNNVPKYRELLEKYDEHLSDFKKINSENNKKMFDELIALEESGQSTTEKELAIMEKYDKIMDEWIENQQKYETSLRAGMRDLLNKYFIENDSGYDGIEMADDGHRYIDMKREDVHTFIVFKNTQIKSADPVTYDDNGNVIPLSQRFKNDNADIRYALPMDDEALDEMLEDMRENGVVFDPEGIIAKGAPVVPDSQRTKIHTKARAYMVFEQLADNNLLSNKSRKEFFDVLYKAMNSFETATEKQSFAREAAEFYVARLLTEAKTENPEVRPAHRRLSWLNIGVGKLSFSPSDIAEMRAVLDESEFRKIFGRWGRKTSGTPSYMLDMFTNEVSTTIPGMSYIGRKHPVDALLELDKLYDEARKTITVDKYISAYWDSTDDDILAMVQNAQEAIINGFEAQDRAVMEAKLETTRELAESYKEQFDTLRGTMRYRGYIASRVEKLNDMKKGVFHNSSIYKEDTFDKILGKLTSIEWRKNLSVTRVREVMKDIANWYSKENALLGYIDKDNVGYYDEGIAKKMQALANGDGAITAAELAELDQVLGYLTKFIETYNKVYINGKWVEAKPMAEGYIEKLKSGAEIKEGIFRNLRQKYFTSFGDAASVTRYFDRYQKGGFFTDIFEMMRAAAIKADTEEMRLMRDYEAFMKENPKYLTEAEKTEIEFAGVKIPKMTAISLLMTMKREQARKGLAISGFKFTDENGKTVRIDGFAPDIFKDPYAGMTQDERAVAEREDAIKAGYKEVTKYREAQETKREQELLSVVTARQNELEKLLSDADKEYVKILERGYNEEARKLKADRDMEKYGFTNALSDYYYPIRRANSAKSVDTSYSAELDRVSNASFNKDIVKGAAGELFIQNADVLFRNHVKAVCQYATLSPAIEAYNKLFNMDISGNPNKPVSVKTESENIWSGANEYFRNLIGDIQGVPRTRGEGTEILSYIRGGYAKFQLGANPKTWASQLSSAFAATSILDIDSMAKATGISGKDVDKYCAIAELRNAENTAAMAQGVMTPGKRIRTKLDKVSDVLMKPIGWVDRGVVRRLFAVCQVQVQKNGGAKIGTEANKVEAGKLLERVILETQQNSFATEKSAAMRSGNEILKTFTMFSADGMKMVGRVMDGFGEVSAIKARLKGADKATKEAAKAELAAAGKKLGRSVGAMALSSLHMALVAQFFRHLYDKEEDDDTVLAVTWDMALDFGGGMLGGLPLWRDLYTRLTDGFGVENCTLETFNALMDSTAGVVTLTTKAMQGKATPQEAARAAKNVIYSACQFGGIPVRNVMNLVGGITKRFSPEAAYTVDGWFYEKNYQNDLWRAVEDGDDRMVNMLVTLAVNDKTGSTLTEAAHTELRRLISAGYNALPREVGKTITVDGTEYAMSEEEREMVREAYATATDKLDKLFANSAYSRLTDEEKTDAIRYVYNTAYNAALADVYGIDRGNAAIIAETVGYDTAATLYIRTKGIESDKGKDGKTIAGTKRKKTVAAINSMPISTEKKLFLICAKGYALSDGDVKGLTAEAAKKRLLRYIVNLPGKTKNEKAMLAEMCGFAVKNGKISLKNSA